MSSEVPVTLIPGDGIGPEVSEATLRVVEASGVRIAWERVAAGAEVIPEYGTPVPEGVLESIRRNRVALKGPIATPVGEEPTTTYVVAPNPPLPSLGRTEPLFEPEFTTTRSG